MPRNPQGLYTLPLPPVVPGELIEADWANPTLDDIASALTGSLPRNGTAPMLAPLTLSNIPPTQPHHAVDVAYVQQFLSYATGMPVGAVIPLAGASIPNGFLLCDGRAVSRTEYATLFASIGTIYGAGDSSTTFNLPDMRDWFIRGKGDTRQVGSTQTAAFAAHVHGVSDPGHSHTQTAHDHTITTGSHSHGVNDPGHGHTYGTLGGSGVVGLGGGASITQPANTSNNGTGISIQSAGNLGGSTDSKQPGISSSQTGVSVGAAGGDETRPQNVAMNYVIKAVNDSVASAAITGLTSSDTDVLSINNANPAVPELVVHSNVPFGAAKLGSDGKIPLSILPPTDSQFLGFYDASTNTLPVGVFTSGDTYTISVAGTLNVYDPVTLTASPTLVSVGSNIVYITGSLSNPTGWYYTVATNNDVVAVVGGNTGAAALPSGTDAQRPAGVNGYFRYNSQQNVFEGYIGSAWTAVGQGNAASTPFTPSGNISATNVQAAIQELDAEKVSYGYLSATNTPFTPSGNIAANNVQAALQEVDTETQAGLATKVSKSGDTMTGNLTMTSAGPYSHDVNFQTSFGGTGFIRGEHVVGVETKVVIGTEQGPKFWQFKNNGSAYGDAWVDLSDESTKSDIQPIADALAKTLTLRGCTFLRNGRDERSAGLIAQDVQAVLPEAVELVDVEGGVLGLDSTGVVGLLVQAVKELKAEVDVLKGKL